MEKNNSEKRLKKIVLQCSFLCNSTIKWGDQCRPPRELCESQHLPGSDAFGSRLSEDTCSVLLLGLDRKWPFFMVSFIWSENGTDVAVFPPVRLWCYIFYGTLHVTIKDDNCSTILPCHILNWIIARELKIEWEHLFQTTLRRFRRKNDLRRLQKRTN